MRFLLRAYDLDEPAGSGPRLRALAAVLRDRGHEVWATAAAHTLAEARAFRPDLIVAQQWATDEGSRWAASMGAPFAMWVHGPGQFAAFLPQCDVVLDANIDERAAACELEQAAARGRRKPTVSLCMTVANEAATLEDAIRSAAPFVDEIVIGVDRRSADGTAEIARRLATRYFEFEESSPPDFRRMRNRALDHVGTDWALLLDGHEWLEGGERIRQSIETPAWSIEVTTLYEPDENRVPGLTFLFPRLHRKGVRFVGAPAHEEVSTPIERRAQCPDIRVWHERKPGAAASARNSEKSGAELDVLRDASSRGDRRALFYLANGLRESGRHAEAVAAYTDYLRSPNFAEEGWHARLGLARSHRASGALDAARVEFERAILEAPDRAEASYALGMILLEMGDGEAAARWLRVASRLPEPATARLFVETPVYRWKAWHGLALALDRLGDFAGAADAEARALSGGAGAWARENIGYWQGRLRESAA